MMGVQHLTSDRTGPTPMNLADLATPHNLAVVGYGALQLYASAGAALHDGTLFRPGGGGGVSGGGGGGGGRSGGSSGGSSGGGSSFGGSSTGGSGVGAGGILGLLIFGGVAAVIIVIVLLVLRSAKKKGFTFSQGQGEFASAIAEPQLTQSEDEIIAPIREHDPNFTVDGFKERVGRIYFLTIEGWCNNDVERIRGAVADTIFQQWRAQVEGYLQTGRRNVMEQAVIGNVWITSAAHTQEVDTITCRIRAAAADYDVDPQGKIIRGDREVRTYMEDWTLQRSGTAATANEAGQRNCHNCGAPFDGDLAGHCKFCNAPFVTIEYEWVLTRIEQL